jgi:hypothetical protein
MSFEEAALRAMTEGQIRAEERERIAKWCDAQADRVLSERSTYYDDRGDRAAVYERVAEFARGET